MSVGVCAIGSHLNILNRALCRREKTVRGGRDTKKHNDAETRRHRERDMSGPYTHHRDVDSDQRDAQTHGDAPTKRGTETRTTSICGEIRARGQRYVETETRRGTGRGTGRGKDSDTKGDGDSEGRR